MDKDNNRSSIWLPIAKLVFVCIFIFVIYKRLFIKEDFSSLWQNFTNEYETASSINLIACIMLMPLNWLVESEKWRYLMSSFTRIKRWEAFKYVLAGLSFGILTPARLGEYAGRILAVPASQNMNTAFTTFLGSISQNLVTICFGTIGVLYLMNASDWQVLNTNTLFLMVASVFIILLILFFNFNKVLRFLCGFKIINQFGFLSQSLNDMDKISNLKLINLIFISAGRYGIYLVQYILMMRFFGVDLSIDKFCAGISSIFLIQTGIPLPPIFNAMARGEIALQVWNYFEVNEIAILLSTFSIWILNLLLPSILGLFVLLSVNIKQSFEAN